MTLDSIFGLTIVSVLVLSIAAVELMAWRQRKHWERIKQDRRKYWEKQR